MGGDAGHSGPPAFDPFSDRLSRDIRNTLSSALIAELSGEPQAVAACARRWLAAAIPPLHRDYVRERQELYRRIIARIRAAGLVDPRRQAVLLWNGGLFFELHELLETIWPDFPEPEHTALKGLIQAAGVYVHLARGKSAAAAKLAQKARINLHTGAACLTFVGDVELLIDELAAPKMPPPLLRGEAPKPGES